jgi:hypothetical protein
MIRSGQLSHFRFTSWPDDYAGDLSSITQTLTIFHKEVAYKDIVTWLDSHALSEPTLTKINNKRRIK